MDVLFICHRIPYPPNKGDKIRSHALLTHLAKQSRVHLACFVDDPNDLGYCDAVRRIAGGECLFVPLTRADKWFGAVRACLSGESVTTSYLNSRRIQNWISDLTARRHIDCTVVFSSGMASYVLKEPRLSPSSAILDMVDIDSDKWRQYGQLSRGPRAWILRREAETLERFERAAARKFALTLLVSEYEAQSFATIAPESASRILALPNGVDLVHFAPGDFLNPFGPVELPIVMTGRMDYRPNIDGVEWFLSFVLPRLKRQLPRVRFYAVGGNPPASWMSNPELVVTNHVTDVRPYIAHAAAIVAPLRIARGVQNKVLEAMAMEKSVVATHQATRALAVTSGIEVLIENDPSCFADAIIEAVGRSDLGKMARRYVEQYHDWERNLLILDQRLARIGKRTLGAGHAKYEQIQTSGSIAEPAK